MGRLRKMQAFPKKGTFADFDSHGHECVFNGPGNEVFKKPVTEALTDDSVQRIIGILQWAGFQNVGTV